MKRKISILMIAIMLIVSVTACGSTNDTVNSTENDSDGKQEELKKITFVLDWTPNTNPTARVLVT